MTDARLQVIIDAVDKTQTALSSAMGGLERYKRQLRTAGIALSAFGAAGVAGFGLALKAAQEAEITVRRLDQALRLQGLTYEKLSAQIEGTLSALQRKTNFGDEAQREALTTLISLTGDYETSLAALPALLDFATARQVDLKTASFDVGKALSGNVQMLQRYGLELDKDATGTEVLTALTKAFGGQAVAAADPVLILKNQIGDFTELLGKQLLPTATKVLGWLTDVMARLQTLDPALLKAGILVGAVAVALAALGGPILLFLSLVPSLVSGLSLVGTAALAAAGKLSVLVVLVGKLAAVIAVAASAAAVFAASFKTVADVLGQSATVSDKYLDKQKKNIGLGELWLAHLHEEVDTLKQIPATLVNAVIPSFDATTDAEMLLTKATASLETSLAHLRDGATSSAQSLGEVTGATSKMAGTMAQTVQARVDLLRVSELLGASFDDLLEAIGEHVKGGLVPAVAWEVELALQSGRVNLALEALAATVVEGAALLAAMREQGLSLVEMFNRLSAASKVMFKVGAVTDFDQVRAQLEAMGRSIGPALEQYEALLDAGWESAQAWAMVSATIKNSVNKELDEFAEKLVGGKEKLDAMRVAGASWAQMFTELGKLTLDDFADDLVKTKDSVDDFADRGQVAFDKLKLALETMGRSVEPLEALLQSLTDVGLDLGLALEVAATVAGEQLNAELDKLVAGAQNGEVWLRALRAAGADLATMFRVISSLPLAEKIRDVKKEAEEATLAIEHMMAKLDQAVRAQQRTPREKLEAQIADVEKALATTTDLWRRNELEVMLRNMRDQLEQMKVAYAAAQGLFIMGQVAAGTGPQVEAARKLIESLSPLSFQRGGVVTRPTVALLGERGPEAVIPFPALDRLRNMRNQLAQAKLDWAAAQGLFTMGIVGGISFLPGGPPLPPALPTLQRGGVVTRPTVALLGERGPEAVIPFPALDRLADRIAASIGGAPQPVVVTLDGRTIATVLGRRAERQEQVRS